MKRPAGRSIPRWLAVPAALAWAVVACGPLPPTPPPGAPASASPAASLAPAPVSPPVPTASAGAESPPPTLPAGVTVDPGLLEVLPAEIDGVALEPDPATAARIATDLLLAESALSLAVALAVAVAPGSSGSGDLAVASVIRLRPDVFDAAFFQEWRDTYNEAACEVADGVQSEVEAQIGGRIAYIGTCVGGALTYHTYLEEQGFIVSITASGERRFGERILACAPGLALPCG